MYLDIISEHWLAIAWTLPVAWLLIMLFAFWILPRIAFEVTQNAIVIRFFGLTLRHIPISDIDRVSKRLKGKPEAWINTLNGNHRMLVIYRKWKKKPILITPSNRYIFRNKIEGRIKEQRNILSSRN